ncbi:MAG: alpha-glucosidase C-terminal domain-containing protein, partial [Fulvivirga sp.]|nr:alpha-glucosidase C-terminal domain-containing protein [Fulvivirga sp.]
NTGDDRRRTHDMNTANWIPDLFMRRMEGRQEWTLFRANEVSDLHDLPKSGTNTIYEHNDLACFTKHSDSEEIALLVNLRNTSVDYTIPAALENTTWTDVMTAENITLSGQITLSPYQFHILKP